MDRGGLVSLVPITSQAVEKAGFRRYEPSGLNLREGSLAAPQGLFNSLPPWATLTTKNVTCRTEGARLPAPKVGGLPVKSSWTVLEIEPVVTTRQKPRLRLLLCPCSRPSFVVA